MYERDAVPDVTTGARFRQWFPRSSESSVRAWLGDWTSSNREPCFFCFVFFFFFFFNIQPTVTVISETVTGRVGNRYYVNIIKKFLMLREIGHYQVQTPLPPSSRCSQSEDKAVVSPSHGPLAVFCQNHSWTLVSILSKTDFHNSY